MLVLKWLTSFSVNGGPLLWAFLSMFGLLQLLFVLTKPADSKLLWPVLVFEGKVQVACLDVFDWWRGVMERERIARSSFLVVLSLISVVFLDAYLFSTSVILLLINWCPCWQFLAFTCMLSVTGGEVEWSVWPCRPRVYSPTAEHYVILS